MNAEHAQGLTGFMALFGRAAEDSRWIGFADSQEYLALVTYLIERSGGKT